MRVDREGGERVFSAAKLEGVVDGDRDREKEGSLCGDFLFLMWAC